MKKLFFIFNPTSGRAQIKSRLFDIVTFYSERGYLVTVYPTTSVGDARQKIVNLDDNFDLVICSGGDGTLNEVITGVLESKNQFLIGYLPSGSTNDFGRSMGIPMNLEHALENTIAGNNYDVDIGRLNDRYFIYVAGFGLFTNVSYVTSQKVKNIIGRLAYVLEGIKAISELKAYKCSIQYDNGIISGEFILGLVTNSFSIAGFKNPTYSVTTLNDGYFEVLLIRLPKNITELQEIVLDLVNGNLKSHCMICLQTSTLHIESEPMGWTLDGEYGGNYDTVDIINLKRAITIINSNER